MKKNLSIILNQRIFNRVSEIMMECNYTQFHITIALTDLERVFLSF